MYNRFTDRELAFILQAEEKEVDIEGIFDEKCSTNALNFKKELQDRPFHIKKLITLSINQVEWSRLMAYQWKVHVKRCLDRKDHQFA